MVVLSFEVLEKECKVVGLDLMGMDLLYRTGMIEELLSLVQRLSISLNKLTLSIRKDRFRGREMQ